MQSVLWHVSLYAILKYLADDIVCENLVAVNEKKHFSCEYSHSLAILRPGSTVGGGANRALAPPPRVPLAQGTERLWGD